MMRPIRRIFVHESDSVGGDVAFMRHVHVIGNGWNDVGYHYVIPNGVPMRKESGAITWPSGIDGDIQEGRPISIEGAHAHGCNEDSIGICVIGKLHETPPTSAQRLALFRLCVQLCEQYELNPITDILGHRDCPSSSTLCPGRYMYELLPTLRVMVAASLLLRRRLNG